MTDTTDNRRREWTPRARRLYRAWTHTVPVLALGVASWSVLLNGNTAEDAKTASVDAKHAVMQVQQSRLELCEQANDRHDNTIAELDRQIAQLPPQRRAEAKSRRAGTVALLEAITPHRDCAEVLGPTP